MKTVPHQTHHYELYLLGSFTLCTADNQPVTDLRRQVRALLAYLAMASRPYTRHELASLFCHNANDPPRALRHLLSRLRAAAGSDSLLEDGDTVQLDTAHIWIDAIHFSQVLGTDPGKLPLSTLEATLALYQGEFLAGLNLSPAPEFELWLLGYRAHLHRLYERGALCLLDHYQTKEQFDAGITLALQLLQHNPLLEEAHHRLMLLYAQTNQRTAALNQYEQCRQLLADELAVEPSPALVSLHNDIQTGKLLSLPKALQNASPSPDWSAAADFVDREKELSCLQTAWAAARQGKVSLVLIEAEAGSGKTSLAHHFMASQPLATAVVGNCFESTHILAYQPWVELLEQFLASVDEAQWHTLPDRWRDELARLLPALAGERPLAATSQPEQLFAAVVGLLSLSERPLLFFFDDLQWADSASLQLLHYVSERISAPLLLIGAFRLDEAADNPALQTLLRDWSRRKEVTRLALPPLSPEATAQLLAQLWPELPPGHPADHLSEWLHQATNGNPLFISEIVRELSSSPSLPDDLPVPPSLRELIQQRLQQLPGSGRQVLESLAVLDQPASLDLAQQISARSEEEVVQALELGLRWRLIQAKPGSADLAFSHDLMRQAVNQQLSPLRRQLLHRRTAVILSQKETKAATLFYHWRLAGDAKQEGNYAVKAGEEAMAMYAYTEAVQYLQRALELANSEARRAAILRPLGRVYVSLGEWAKAETAYRQGLVEAVKDPRLTAEFQAGLGDLLELKGEHESAREWAQQALATFMDQNDGAKIVELLGTVGRIYYAQGNYDQTLATYNQALEYRHALADERPFLNLHNNMGLVYFEQQIYQEALDHFQQAQQIAERYQHKPALAVIKGNIGNIHNELAQYEHALAYYEQALALDVELDNRLGMATHQGNIGSLHFSAGRHEKALQYHQMALELFEALGYPEGVAVQLDNIGAVYRQQGQFDKAFDYFSQALSIDMPNGNQRGMASEIVHMGSVYRQLGDYDAALNCLAFAVRLELKLGGKSRLATCIGDIAETFVYMRQAEKAMAFCQRAVRLLRVLPSEHDLCRALWLYAESLTAVSNFSAALPKVDEALQIARRIERQDVLESAQLLQLRLQVIVGQLSKAAARQKLNALLVPATDPAAQAAILYEVWRLDKDQEEMRQETAVRYQTLYANAPNILYQQRYQALTDQTLSAPPPLPEPPALITDNPADLGTLLEQVDQFLTELTS